MALHSDIQIYIGGAPVPTFKRLTLHQEIDDHHTLQVFCRMDVLDGLTGELAGQTKNYLGESITLQIRSLGEIANYSSLEFKGVVTAIDSTKGFQQSSGDFIVISAKAGTIITDDGPHYASHNDISLQDILDTTFSSYDKSKLEMAFTPEFSQPLHYSVQNRESSWQYASRLAAQYSEWFYYDGKKLVFGKPEDKDPIKLQYGLDLQEFSMKLNPQPNKFNYFTNDYLTNGEHKKSTNEVGAPGGYNGFVSGKADKLYTKETNVFVNSYNDPQSKSRMDRQVEQHKKMVDQQQVILKGASDNPGVGLGKVIKVMGEEENYGSYRVTSITHTANENGRYQNRFQGVSTEADVYPQTNINAFPRSETQTAVVTENADPEGIGRIKVQFPWQKMMGEMTPWLRIVTPHSGGDKGFHFIPELEEEVLIGFEGGNAERPYVMGSLYHGNHRPQSWKTQKNDIKAMRTRSGHTLEFNDADGAESITLTDKKGNVIHIDTANNNIEISALENMTLNAKNINIKAQENIDMSAGKNFTKSVAENYQVMSKNTSLITEDEHLTDAKKQQHVADEITISSNKENLTLASGKTVDVQSEEKVKLF
ncbi:phage baseplate assembly protein V [uncultured Marixanthomonas sp.]|mgnify:CR=1 FL=1|uniref:type VI secretion system Vgr family protein n=1 Tax=uncultured Marixanthomonas sp. TaxID=757245 RepID=UPI0030D9D03A|tara:strand:+ start:2446 stop:4227 length:1782 start_codon:yes stop_codon:yes gene_type:complete